MISIAQKFIRTTLVKAARPSGQERAPDEQSFSAQRRELPFAPSPESMDAVGDLDLQQRVVGGIVDELARAKIRASPART
jgi:hypothetical protein